MKKLKRILSLALALCLCCSFAFAAAGTSQLPNVGEASLNLTAQQAEAFAQKLRDADKRAGKVWATDYEDWDELEGYVVCGTLIGTGDSAMLWIADYLINVSREAEWPGEIALGSGCISIAFEELWQWDGSKAVGFAPVNTCGGHVALREVGVEAFSVYGGTDVDGDEWDAFYPFSKGMLAKEPSWCRAWCCAYDYRLEAAGVAAAGKAPKNIAIEFVQYLTDTNQWPVLPFDWTTFYTTDEMWEMARIFDVSAGKSWQNLYPDGGFPYISSNENAVPGALMTAAFIVDDTDDQWVEVNDLAGMLESYAAMNTGYAGFADVPANAYYADAVKWAAENGITTGTEPGVFSPNDTCTRGQVVTFLWRMAGQPEPTSKKNHFRDVKADDYFYKPVLWAVEQGITNGTSATAFSPNDLCTRAHVVTFLWRALNKPAARGSSALAAQFPTDYYTDAVAWADSVKLLSGTAQAFTPGANCPRSDIVTYLYRCYLLAAG
ncbi:MAG: S-layer homology domain-containing protein [Ruminococcaceae bacterium]|nr:S-layer homology domain-containing protein [Oscillospiraceae bacterium]